MNEKTKKWLKALVAAIVTGISSSGLSALGVIATNAAGVQIQTLDLKQLGIMCLSGGVVGALAYLKQSPVPPDSGDTAFTSKIP